MADLDLFGSPPKIVDFTVPHHYLNDIIDMVTFEPSTNIFMSECLSYGLDWLVLWSMASVITDSFRNKALCLEKNYFGLQNVPGSLQSFRTWQEGVRAGVQTVCAYLKLNGIVSLSDTNIVWPGTSIIIKMPGKFSVLKDFDTVYGAGFPDRVKASYDAVVAYAEGLKNPLPDPVVSGPALPLPPPPSPIVIPEPLPAPVPAGISTWKITLAKIVGVVSSIFLIAQLFLPGWADQVIKALLALADILLKH